MEIRKFFHFGHTLLLKKRPCQLCSSHSAIVIANTHYFQRPKKAVVFDMYDLSLVGRILPFLTENAIIEISVKRNITFCHFSTWCRINFPRHTSMLKRLGLKSTNQSWYKLQSPHFQPSSKATSQFSQLQQSLL